jgi:hypothetical protein
MIAARIARRLVRKITKPAALLLTDLKIRRAQARVAYFERLLCGLTPHDLKRDVVDLIARRNQIRSW